MRVPQAMFSVLLLAIIAAAGLVKGVNSAWIFAVVTAALAFFSEEARSIAGEFGRMAWYRVANVLALTSWLTGAYAAIALVLAI